MIALVLLACCLGVIAYGLASMAVWAYRDLRSAYRRWRVRRYVRSTFSDSEVGTR